MTAENGAPVGAGGPPGQAGPCDVLSPEAFEATPTDALAFIRCGQTDLVLQQLEATDALSGTTTSRLAIEEQGIFISDEVFTVGSGEIDLDMSTAGEGERYFGILALLKREIAAGQYLLFLSEKDEWRFYGQVGLPADSLRRPAVSVVRAGEDAWLAITSDGSSSGANWRNIRWFDLRSDALEEAVFSYQTEIGGTYDGGLILVTASGRPYLSSTEEGERVITLNYSIEQNAPGLGIPIFSERAALYNRDPETGVFLFDAEQSDVTEEDLENGFSQKSQSDFLAFAEEEIANAINLGGVTTRTNIREYLEEIEDESDARTALLEILDATE